MDDRDIPGAGLPFAIGAAIGNPDNNVVLICDKNSLFLPYKGVTTSRLNGIRVYHHMRGHCK